MGQMEPDYLTAIHWNDSLSLQQRMDRGPFFTAFAMGRADDARSAVERARRDEEIADATYRQVKEQAVYALQCDGLTVRAIAERTGIPKSEVGRISRALDRVRGDGDDPGARIAPLALFRAAEFRDRVRLAWGFR